MAAGGSEPTDLLDGQYLRPRSCKTPITAARAYQRCVMRYPGGLLQGRWSPSLIGTMCPNVARHDNNQRHQFGAGLKKVEVQDHSNAGGDRIGNLAPSLEIGAAPSGWVLCRQQECWKNRCLGDFREMSREGDRSFGHSRSRDSIDFLNCSTHSGTT